MKPTLTGCLAVMLSLLFTISPMSMVNSSTQQCLTSSTFISGTGCYSYLVGMKLINDTFDIDLLIYNSSTFFETGRQVESQIKETGEYDLGGLWTVNVSYFRPGSVLVYFDLFVKEFPGNSSDIEALLRSIVTGQINTSLPLDSSFLYLFKEDVNGSAVCNRRRANLTISGNLFTEVVSVFRRLSYVLSANVELDNCTSKMANGFWSVYKVENNQLTKKVLEGRGMSNWTLKAFTLDYGLHCIMYQVKMNDSFGLEIAMDYGFVDVKETKLRGSLLGFVYGTYKLFTWGQNITANASLSSDPDSPTGWSSGIVYYLLCAKYGESYPYPISDNPSIVSQTPDDTDLGGCFQTGAGLVSFNRSVTTFTTRYMTPNVVYMLRLYLVKTGRAVFGTTYLFFVVLPATTSPPLVSSAEPTSSSAQTTSTSENSSLSTDAGTTRTHIEEKPEVFITCMENCNHYVVTSFRLAFTADCRSCANRTTHIWQLLTKSRTAENSSTVWRSIDNIKDFTDPKAFFNSTKFIILANKLSPGKEYQVILTVLLSSSSTDLWNISTIFAFNTSLLPRDGNCNISPISGMALVTIFTLSCDSWRTVHLPLSYHFYYRTLDGLMISLGGGKNSTLNTTLAAGKEAHSYKMNITSVISDTFGGETSVEISVQVCPFYSTSSPAVAMLNFVDGETSELRKHIKDGDVSKAARLALNVLQTASSPYGNNIGRLEKRRIIDAIVEQMGNVSVNDVQSSLRISSVIEAASVNFTVFSPKSRQKSLEILRTLSEVLENTAVDHVGSMRLRHIRDSGESLSVCLGNILSGSSRKASNDFKKLATSLLALLDKVGGVLLSVMLVGEAPITVKTPSLQLTLIKQAPDQYSGMKIKDDIGEFTLPTGVHSFMSTKHRDHINAIVLSANFNPYSWSSTSRRVNTHLTSLSFRDNKGDIIRVKDLDNDVGITLSKGDSTKNIWSRGFVKVSSNDTVLRYHKIKVKHDDTYIFIRIKPEKNNTNFTVLARHGSKPTSDKYDFTAKVPNPLFCDLRSSRNTWNCNEEAYHIWVRSDVLGDYYIGITAVTKDNSKFLGNSLKARRRRSSGCIFPNGEIKSSCLQIKYPPTKAPVSKDVKPEYNSLSDCNYTISVEVRRCVFWSDKEDLWTSQGCKVKPVWQDSQLYCECDHLTWFAGEILVEPTPLQYDTIFLNLTQMIETNNTIVLAMIITFLLFYIVVVILVKRLDRADEQMHRDWLPTDKDNHSNASCLKPRSCSFQTPPKGSFVLSEHHLWISVVSKPQSSSFTRTQRATCCLSLLFAAMVTNAIFYQAEGKSENTIQFGPFCFNQRQIVIGLQSGLLTSFFCYVIVAMFKFEPTIYASKTNIILAWFSRIFAWTLCFLVVCCSSTFTLFYSMQWGSQVSKQWLSSIFISSLQDIVVVQPGRMVIFAFFGSFLKRKVSCLTGYRQRNDSCVSSGHHIAKNVESEKESRGNGKVLKQSRLTKYKAIMRSTMKESGLFMLTIVLLMIIVYGNHNHHRFYITKSLKHCFKSSAKVKDPKQMWEWLQNRLLKCLYTDLWYNNIDKANADFIENMVSFRCGMPRIRQLRVKPDSCVFASEDGKRLYNSTCFSSYSQENEDTTTYYRPMWKPLPKKRLSLTNSSDVRWQPWQYKSEKSLNMRAHQGVSSTYSGGGYIAVLGHQRTVARQHLINLDRDCWVDRRTRAIFIEFTLFNPNTALFLVGKQIFENPAVGGLLQMTSFSSVAIYSPPSSSSYNFHLVCQVMFFGMITYHLCSVFMEFYRSRLESTKNPWIWLDLAIVCTACLQVAFHFVKETQIQHVVAELKENPYHPGSLDHVVYWDSVTDALLAILVFLSTVKLLKLNIFLPNIRVLATSLYLSLKDCLHFFVFLGVLFIAFCHFVVILDSNSGIFPTFKDVFLNQFLMSLGAAPWTSPSTSSFLPSPLFHLYWVTYQLALSLVILNIFASILNSAHRHSLDAVAERKEYLEFSNFVIKRILSFLRRIWLTTEGVSRNKVETRDTNEHRIMIETVKLHVPTSRHQASSASNHYLNSLCTKAVEGLVRIEEILNHVEENDDIMDETVLMAFLELRFKTSL